MKRILLALSLALSLTACNEGDSPTGPSKGGIRPGIYNGAIEFNTAPTITLTAEYNFKADGGFVGRLYVDNITSTCMILDGTSTWTSTASSYTIAAADIKTRGDCDEEWVTESKPTEKTEIRNVTDTSFEEYVEMEAQPAMWVKFNKI
jgi:hypothetical protein